MYKVREIYRKAGLKDPDDFYFDVLSNNILYWFPDGKPRQELKFCDIREPAMFDNSRDRLLWILTRRTGKTTWALMNSICDALNDKLPVIIEEAEDSNIFKRYQKETDEILCRLFGAEYPTKVYGYDSDISARVCFDIEGKGRERAISVHKLGRHGQTPLSIPPAYDTMYLAGWRPRGARSSPAVRPSNHKSMEDVMDGLHPEALEVVIFNMDLFI